MTNALDVAQYIVNKCGPVAAMKLQKLVYYAQAWSLVWDGRPLFRNRIEAWANGPVTPTLYYAHKGQFLVSRIAGGVSRRLGTTQRGTIDAIIDYYARHSPLWLSNLTHAEKPWRNARKGLKPGERGNNVITRSAMEEYYGGL